MVGIDLSTDDTEPCGGAAVSGSVERIADYNVANPNTCRGVLDVRTTLMWNVRRKSQFSVRRSLHEVKGQ